MKRALLIGINYNNNNDDQLHGCITDIENMRQLLVNIYTYDPSNIIMLRDDVDDPLLKPTHHNIIDQLYYLVKQSDTLDECWIHYSGHGNQVPDLNGDEKSKLDSVIIPVDYRINGVIIDDEIQSITQNIKCKTIMLFDSCNSGTVCDLQWSFVYDGSMNSSIRMNNTLFITNPNIYMFSSSTDTQFSLETYNMRLKENVGLFTNTFIECLKERNYNASVLDLYKDICINLMENGHKQRPILSSSSIKPEYVFTTSDPISPALSVPSSKQILRERMYRIINNNFV